MNLRGRTVVGSVQGKRDSLNANTSNSRDGWAMWKRMTVGGIAGVSGWVAIGQVVGYAPHVEGLVSLAVATCVTSMVRLMLWCQQRPVGDVYKLGFEAGKQEGRRQAVKEFNARPPSPKVTAIRPAKLGLSEFNARAKARASKRDLVEKI